MTRALVCMALGIVLAGCGSSEDELGAPPRYRIPGCESYDTAPCDVLDASCDQRLMNIAACLRGEEPAAPPPVTILTENEYAAELRMQFAASDPPPYVQQFETALTWLGLVAPGAFDTETTISERAVDINGFYRVEDKTIVIIDHGKKTNVETASDSLVHEFVHALQDRELDLATWGDGYPRKYDVELALRAIMEGEARFHETRYRAAMLGLDPRRVDWPRTFQNAVVASKSWILEQPSPFVAGDEAFPYAWGARYLSFDWNDTGHDGVLARFASPPTTTHELMASTFAVLADDFVPTDFELPPEPSGWMRLGDDRLGAFGTFLVLAQLDPVNAETVALGWRGDRLFLDSGLDRNGESGTVAVWGIELANDTDAFGVSALLETQGFSTTVTANRVTAAKAERTSFDLSWVFASN